MLTLFFDITAGPAGMNLVAIGTYATIVLAAFVAVAEYLTRPVDPFKKALKQGREIGRILDRSK